MIDPPVLLDRVRLFLAACPDRTVEEVARGLSARTVDVRAVLRDGVVSGVLSERRSTVNGPRLFRVSRGVWDRTGRRAKSRTQEQSILAVLSDGDWHSSGELYRRVPSIVHSRIARLRKRFVIEHRGGGQGAENHFYRLVGTSEAAAADGGRTVGSAAASGAPACTVPPESESAGVPVQLTVGEAA